MRFTENRQTIWRTEYRQTTQHSVMEHAQSSTNWTRTPSVRTQTERRFTDEVAFVMDVLLPEATVHALAAVLSVSLERAKETYKCGPEYDWSEMELCSHYLTKNMSEEVH
ncbi:PWWP domain-containing DNA repair factor 3A-like [Trematomus bernacchii]|uniref:PWWP domain-containing DNA repair factor 3A-like n=1 Tax=Trematomus bernacchii TaxID=40690 RepID=UPI00146AB88A|nr:PWWP domain-containing DNA repair factor 3A-like [Trematomus bernacchii]